MAKGRKPLSQRGRNELLRHRRELFERREKLLDEFESLYEKAEHSRGMESRKLYEQAERRFEEAEKLLDLQKKVEREYFKRLPLIAMSCCPYDNEPLMRTFDPFGLDGPWWETHIMPGDPQPCAHFCVLRGALNYSGRRPSAGIKKVHPGPEVPYVIPRLLKIPGMIAVIGRLEMNNGYIAYPIAYFAKKRPPARDLAAEWRNTTGTYWYKNEKGEGEWREETDPWDFNLRPWIERGKVGWCPPDSGNTFISTEPPEKCPYLDLPGRKKPIIVEGNRFWEAGLPGPSPLSNSGPW